MHKQNNVCCLSFCTKLSLTDGRALLPAEPRKCCCLQSSGRECRLFVKHFLLDSETTPNSLSFITLDYIECYWQSGNKVSLDSKVSHLFITLFYYSSFLVHKSGYCRHRGGDLMVHRQNAGLCKCIHTNTHAHTHPQESKFAHNEEKTIRRSCSSNLSFFQ